jgi:hypothetical protein
MKVRKTELNLKMASDIIRDISSPKASLPYRESLRISGDTDNLNQKTNVNQIITQTTSSDNQSRTDLIHSSYSKRNIGTGDTHNLKSPGKPTSSRLSPVNTNKSSSPPLDIREEKIKEAKIRLAKGYYSRVEVYSKVAERIIDTLI